MSRGVCGSLAGQKWNMGKKRWSENSEKTPKQSETEFLPDRIRKSRFVSSLLNFSILRGCQNPMIPTTVPVMQVARVPAIMERNPRDTISSRFSGAIVPMPPIMMPRLPGLANPHMA